MKPETKMRMVRYGDTSLEACAHRLRIARIASGLMPTQLAKESGMKIAAYSNQENGRAFPSRDVMRTMYRAYGIDYNYFFEGEFKYLVAEVQSKIFSAAVTLADQGPQGEGKK